MMILRCTEATEKCLDVECSVFDVVDAEEWFGTRCFVVCDEFVEYRGSVKDYVCRFVSITRKRYMACTT